ncbi:MAG: hypothetical protein RLZZ234_236 [Candidatus Parcubacteria bacterium]
MVCSLAGATLHAQVMQSDNYKIESDSVNFGGARSTSSTYTLEDTLGEVGTGDSAAASYRLGAGYQHTLLNYLSLSASPDVVLSPAIGGLTGGTSNGSTTLTVVTDNAAGYQLMITASNSPAMQSATGVTIGNYVPSSADPDFTFAVPAGDERFGYSPEGVDIATRFKDNGVACNSGSGDTTLACWDGLTTSAAEFARRVSGNHPNGTDTVLNFRVGLGANAMIEEGIYYATTTITALPL